ncbi:MAG TPA: 16S rRNA (guanine(966)-N(2))-methyltransferase RsmD [Tepidisphaeraceae bacterium]|jgi:16S rRNA (guanine(966)-N(2))-methyltransferase RsmD|nr:16S rRNA (guanine(966)-N(2))-methyltransferase RsmD [Tepidisphaeraceae bacterium]
MRIIAGKHRGRNLLPPLGDVTRPITDRAKQSLFDILAPTLEDARVYDCFAGTGSMGLECLSRGAAAVKFFEADRSAIERLKKNIAAMDDEHRCRIIAGDLFKWFAQAPAPDAKDRGDIIFLDPPYRFLRERPADLQTLAGVFVSAHLAADGAVIFRHDAADALELPGLKRYDLREYGGMQLEFMTCA